MNTKLMRKIEQRLESLEQKADHLKNQIVNIDSYSKANDNLNKEKLQLELDETLNKIRHINLVNKNVKC